MITESNVTNTVIPTLACASKFLFKISLEYSASDMEEVPQ